MRISSLLEEFRRNIEQANRRMSMLVILLIPKKGLLCKSVVGKAWQVQLQMKTSHSLRAGYVANLEVNRKMEHLSLCLCFSLEIQSSFPIKIKKQLQNTENVEIVSVIRKVARVPWRRIRSVLIKHKVPKAINKVLEDSVFHLLLALGLPSMTSHQHNELNLKENKTKQWQQGKKKTLFSVSPFLLCCSFNCRNAIASCWSMPM